MNKSPGLKTSFLWFTLLLAAVFSTAGCSTKEHTCDLSGCKPRDTCDSKCWLQTIWVFYGADILRANAPCSAQYNLKPGDKVDITIPSGASINDTSIKACSSNPWKFTVTPSAGATLDLYRVFPPDCYYGTSSPFVSSAAGVPVILTGSAGCVNETDKNSIHVLVSGPSGSTFHIDFN